MKKELDCVGVMDSYCSKCKTHVDLGAEELRWYKIYQALKQHPLYKCLVCNTYTTIRVKKEDKKT